MGEAGSPGDVLGSPPKPRSPLGALRSVQRSLRRLVVLLSPHLTDMPRAPSISCGDRGCHQHSSQRPFSAQEDPQRSPWLSLEERDLPHPTLPSPEGVISPLGPILGLPPSTHWSPR